MEPYATPDDHYVAQGVRLTDGSAKLKNLLATAPGPVSVTDMETALRPDLDQREHATPYEWDCLTVGMCRIYPWGDHSYTLVAPKYGLLPGRWFGWESALGAYGYFLGGETSGHLDDLVEFVASDPQWGHYVTMAELQRFVEGNTGGVPPS